MRNARSAIVALAALAAVGSLAARAGAQGLRRSPATAEANAAKIATAELVAQIAAKWQPGISEGGGSLVVSGKGSERLHLDGIERIARSCDASVAKSVAGSLPVQVLLRRGSEAAAACNKAFAEAKPGSPEAGRLAVLLGHVGDKDSIPLLIDALGKSQAQAVGSHVPEASCTWALWRLTGRRFSKSPEDWKAWWQAVEASFLLPADRAKARVEADQVLPIAERLKDSDDDLDRERLVVLGPSAAPHLLKAMRGAGDDYRYRLAWAIDEANAAPQMPADIRREYFTRRLAEAGQSYSAAEQALFERALSQQSLADFCRTAIEAERRRTANNHSTLVWNWLHMDGSGVFRDQLKRRIDELPAAVEVLVAGLGNTDPAARKTAAKIADTIGFTSDAKPPALLAALEKQWLAETDERLRYNTGFAFSRFDCPELTRAFLRELDSNRLEILGDCVNIIGWHARHRMNGPEANTVNHRLVDLIGHAEDGVRRGAVRGLQSRAPRLLDPYLKRLCADPVRDVREFCIMAMQEMKDPRHTELLVDLALNEGPPLRDHAFAALSDPNHRRAVGRLAPLLRDPQTMYLAQWAIVAEGGPEATVALLSEFVRGNTVGGTILTALERLTGRGFKTPEEAVKWWWGSPRERPAVDEAAADSNALPDSWAALREGLGVEAYQAAGRLAAAGEAGVDLVADQLKPVRFDPNRTESLLRGLDAWDFKTRQESSRELFRLGRLVEPALKAALEGNLSEEARTRAEELLKAAQSPQPASAEVWQQAWAVRALEWAGIAQARKVLDSLAGGSPGAYLTDQAAEALGRTKGPATAQAASGPAGK